MEYGNGFPLIWSLSRRCRRRMCPLAAVLHYREAQAGFDPDADLHLRRINQLHRSIPEQKYLRQLFLRMMREIFYRGGDDPETLAVLASDKCESDLRRMIFGDAPQILTTLNGSGASVTTVRNSLRRAIFEYHRRLLPAWRGLLAVPVAQRRFISSPLKLQINELTCYASPLLAYSAGGKLWIVELRSGEISSAVPEVLLMHRYYALNVSGRIPESVVSCCLDPDTGKFTEINSGFDVSETLRTMSDEAALMSREMALDAADISRNTGNCGHCVFASYCGENNRKEPEK